jgi:hypothetical protein
MISSINSAVALAYLPATSSRSSAPQPAGDQVAMSLSPDTFAGLVRDAGNMPDVRGDVVAAYKSQIQSGNYPTEDDLDGLVDLMGGTWAKQASS